MNRSTQMVAACLPRAKSVPLAVDITVYPNTDAGGWYFEPVLTELLPHSKRWGHLAINFDLGCSNLPLQDDFLDKSTVEKLRHLDASLLEELCIQNDEWDGAGRCRWDWSHWSTPKLRHIETIFYFPRSLPGLANVSSLVFMLPVEFLSLSGILLEISRMDNLQDFTFALCCGEEMDGERIELFERIEFPRVQRLHISTELNSPFEDRTPAVKRSLFSSLFFPCATYLHLEFLASIYADQGQWEDDGPHDFHFNKEISRVLRHVDQFSRVRDFHLRILTPLEDHHDVNQGFTKLSIPLDMLPNVKHFTLESNTRARHRGTGQSR